MKDGKLIDSSFIHCTSTLIYLPNSPPDRVVAKICDKLQSSATVWPNVSNLYNLDFAHQICYQYYSVDRIFVIVLLSLQPVWFVDTVYCWSQLHHGNNIVHVPAPTLAEYFLFFIIKSAHRVYSNLFSRVSNHTEDIKKDQDEHDRWVYRRVCKWTGNLPYISSWKEIRNWTCSFMNG